MHVFRRDETALLPAQRTRELDNRDATDLRQFGMNNRRLLARSQTNLLAEIG